MHVAKSRCAFVNFVNRAAAERAAEVWANGLEIDGERVSVKWGRSRPKSGTSSTMTAPAPVTVTDAPVASASAAS